MPKIKDILGAVSDEFMLLDTVRAMFPSALLDFGVRLSKIQSFRKMIKKFLSRVYEHSKFTQYISTCGQSNCTHF